jgi:molecular chaperone GrpE (heat shock protein)
MKAKLIFNLDNPDDATSHLRAVKSVDLAIAISDILQLKKKLERIFTYEDNNNTDVFDGIQVYADEVYKILNERGINIDELLD